MRNILRQNAAWVGALALSVGPGEKRGLSEVGDGKNERGEFEREEEREGTTAIIIISCQIRMEKSERGEGRPITTGKGEKHRRPVKYARERIPIRNSTVLNHFSLEEALYFFFFFFALETAFEGSLGKGNERKKIETG